MHTVRIGAGAGYSGDRIEPSIELAERGEIAYLVFECLAERTIALAQLAKRSNADLGYDPLLATRMEAVLPLCKKQGIKIISNMGAANPLMAARKTVEVARQLNLCGTKVAAVLGDDVLPAVCAGNFSWEENDASCAEFGKSLISANAYLGAAPIVEALESEADVILTGRTADPAIFLAAMVHEFGWSMQDWNVLGQGTIVGHLLECAGQLTGGYFADPGYKDVPNLGHLGFPLAEVAPDGTATLTKLDGTGGVVTLGTCKEQLLYEIQDPSAYVTPDVIADFTTVSIREDGKDRVHVSGGTGYPRPDRIKASVGLLDGYIGEGQISYAGEGALERAKLAEAVIRERLSRMNLSELRTDFIGVNSILGGLSSNHRDVGEVRLRIGGRSRDRSGATALAREMEALYTNGPAGGGGIVTSVKEIITIESVLVPRNAISPTVRYEVA